MAQISCRNLSCGYDNRAVIKDLSFTVNGGDYLVIMGENGAGKSTLVKTLLGLLKPIEGEAVFGDGLKKSEIGYLSQQTAVQRDFPASVGEVVLSGCLPRLGRRPFFGKAEKALMKKNLETMGLSGFEKRSYRFLSGGQQQRVLLARALCATDKILLLDEPVSGLDPNATEEMYALIERLNQNGTTIIMISHDITESLKYATHILRIGKEYFFGTKAEYLSAAHKAAYSNDGGKTNG
ncbi:MAG: metal ABC transporter ATP-binding protein [Clostridia bacterium]|nr:metal ABC transporter ATP-binding protein [Clostridia bacterium]